MKQESGICRGLANSRHENRQVASVHDVLKQSKRARVMVAIERIQAPNAFTQHLLRRSAFAAPRASRLSRGSPGRSDIERSIGRGRLFEFFDHWVVLAFPARNLKQPSIHVSDLHLLVSASSYWALGLSLGLNNPEPGCGGVFPLISCPPNAGMPMIPRTLTGEFRLRATPAKRNALASPLASSLDTARSCGRMTASGHSESAVRCTAFLLSCEMPSTVPVPSALTADLIAPRVSSRSLRHGVEAAGTRHFGTSRRTISW